MDNNKYTYKCKYGGSSMQWISEHCHHQTTNKPVGESANVNASEILLDSQSSEVSSGDHLIVNNDGYVAKRGNGPHDSVTNIDQVAAENLIYMARDGKMMSTNIIANENGTIVVSASDDTPIHCETIMRQAGLMIQHEESNDIIYNNSHSIEHYTDNTPQMVTEEIITDDWVQHQGEERVEIPAEQIMGSGSHILLDIEVPLSTVQDEYSVLRPYPCDFCSRRFRKKASLMNHMVTHQNDRPHLCKLCNSRFLRRHDLINHLKAHAEKEPALDDNDFLHFDGSADGTSIVNQRGPANGNEYNEHNWNISSESIPIYIKNSPKANGDVTIVTTTITDVNFNFPPITSQATVRVNEMTYVGGSNVGSSRNISLSRIGHLNSKEDSSYSVTDFNVGGGNDSISYKGTGQLHYTDNRVDQENSNTQTQQKPAVISKRCKPFACQECGLAFAREKALVAHAKSHRQEDSYECTYCNEVFGDGESLQQHLKIHQFEDSDSEYEPNDGDCDIERNDFNGDNEADCDDNSESQNGMSSTRTSELDTDQKLYGDFYCNECGASFHRLDRLQTHTKLHRTKATVGNEYNDKINTNNNHQQQQHCCNTCGETFAEALDLLAHAEIHARYPTFKCVLCGETFIEENTIKCHLQSQHDNEMTDNSCVLCGKGCRDRKALIKHAWDHSLEKCHRCTKCGKNFHNKARLKRHWASHRDKSVQCEICHEEFPDGRTLSNHRHSHSTTSNGKLFPCNECGKTFGSRSSQQIHLRIHTGEKPYGCRYCWKAFADGGTLRKHERIHTGEKPYVCSVCTRAFNQRVVLREHIRSHHSGLDNSRGTYYCRVCSAEMSTSRELIQHLIEHSDVNTAKKRQPVAGPRKYKRRRKLKPHELARLKDEGKLGLKIGGLSDLDISDIDEIFALNEFPTSLSKGKNQNFANNNQKEKATNKKNRQKKPGKEEEELDFEVDVDLDVNIVNWGNNHNKNDQSKGVPQSMTTETTPTVSTTTIIINHPESLFNRMDDALNKSDDLPDINKNRILRRKRIYNLNQPAQKHNKAHQLKETSININCTVDTVKDKGQKRNTTNKRNERSEVSVKYNVSMENENNGNSEKSFTTSPRPLLSKTPTIVDDYDIISPELQPPTQISCSPVLIKQENCPELEAQLQSPSQQVKNGHERIKQNHKIKVNQNLEFVTTSSNDDAHLLLEASGLRHDLDDILQSPNKMYKYERRQRFTSESSLTTQFMTDQVVEEQLLIKIEPTSPDLTEIVNGVVNMINNNNNINCISGMELLENHRKRKYIKDDKGNPQATSKQQKQQQWQKQQRTKKCVEQRRIINPSKYVTFPVIDITTNLKHSTAKNFNSNNMINLNTAATSTPIKTSSLTSVSEPSHLDYNDYRITHAKPSPTITVVEDNNSNSHFNNNSLDSIKPSVSAAEANEAADQQQNQQVYQKQQHPLKSRRYFECEMCSMVFSDRAQLLDHVPIHI